MKTIIVKLEDGRTFTFMKNENTILLKIRIDPLFFEDVKFSKQPKEGEKLEFQYKVGDFMDEFKSGSKITSVTTME